MSPPSVAQDERERGHGQSGSGSLSYQQHRTLKSSEESISPSAVLATTAFVPAPPVVTTSAGIQIAQPENSIPNTSSPISHSEPLLASQGSQESAGTGGAAGSTQNTDNSAGTNKTGTSSGNASMNSNGSHAEVYILDPPRPELDNNSNAGQNFLEGTTSASRTDPSRKASSGGVGNTTSFVGTAEMATTDVQTKSSTNMSIKRVVDASEEGKTSEIKDRENKEKEKDKAGGIEAPIFHASSRDGIRSPRLLDVGVSASATIASTSLTAKTRMVTQKVNDNPKRAVSPVDVKPKGKAKAPLFTPVAGISSPLSTSTRQPIGEPISTTTADTPYAASRISPNISQSGKPNRTGKPKSLNKPPHARERRLFVFHGFRSELLAQLSAMGVDPDFIVAHILRRPYRPRLVQLDGQQRHGERGEKVVRWSFAHFQYPELVCRIREESSSSSDYGFLREKKREDEAVKAPFPPSAPPGLPGHAKSLPTDEYLFVPGRVFGDPPVHTMPGREDAVAMCRASLWMSELGDAILLLDRPIWRDPQSQLKKTYWHDNMNESLRQNYPDDTSSIHSFMSLDPSFATPAAAAGMSDQPVAPSLHDSLQEWLNNYPVDFDYRAVLSSVVELAYDRWLELFDALDIRPTMSSSSDPRKISGHAQQEVNDLLGLYWRSQMALETNADGFSYMNARGMVMPRGRADWGVLLSKIKRRIELLHLGASIVRPTHVGPSHSGQNRMINTYGVPGSGEPGKRSEEPGEKIGRQHQQNKKLNTPFAALTNSAATGIPVAVMPEIMAPQYPPPQEKESKRGLDRVAYMGGVFLPFTIISSIMSMSEPFGPGQHLHWVFWVVAIPLAIGAVLFIYADSIRRAEVWIEVADIDPRKKTEEKKHQIKNSLASAKQCQNQDTEKDGKTRSTPPTSLPPPVPGPRTATRSPWDLRRKVTRKEGPTLEPIISASESGSVLELKTQKDNSSKTHQSTGEEANATSMTASRSPLLRESFLPPAETEPAHPPGQFPPSSSSSSSGSFVTSLPRLPRPELDNQVHLISSTPERTSSAHEENEEMGSDGESGIESQRPTMVIHSGADGEGSRAYKRQKLGWGGAWKTMVGYYVASEDVPMGVKAYEVRGWAKRPSAS